MTRDTWKLDHPRCFICGSPATDCHEMARGPFKAAAMKEPAAWIATCQACHERLDGMPIARQLAYKAIGDLENYDRIVVNQLRHRQLDAVSEREVLAEVVGILRSQLVPV